MNAKRNSQPTKKKDSSAPAFFQNRELSWLEFNKRVLDQASDPTVPLLERLNFVSIFWSNLQEFFMVRVGSLSDLELLKRKIVDNKSGWTPGQQLTHIYKRCHELYGEYEETYKKVSHKLAKKGVHRLSIKELNDKQLDQIKKHFHQNVSPFLSPQIVNSRHPFPHLTNGAIYIVVRLNEKSTDEKDKDKAKDKNKNLAAKNVTLGLIPLPTQVERIVQIENDGDELAFVLLEDIIDYFAPHIFSMYKVKHTNIICVTRNADLDVVEGEEEQGDDYREHMKRILKKRSRLHPVRLECARELSEVVGKTLKERLELGDDQVFITKVPLDMSYTYSLVSMIEDADLKRELTYVPFTPQWPKNVDKNRSVINQISEHELLLSYPYETMDVLVRLLREAAVDPSVVSIKITLYRLASHSQLAEALISAAENGKDVTALFELRARFDEFNNIEWSQRFESAGCNVIYGFQDYKVHSKICSITRNTPNRMQYITQLGTGNYNEKTARLYTDLSFMTTDEQIGKDACAFFQNMQMETLSDEYKKLWVAPLQIKQNIIHEIDKQIALKKAGKNAGVFFKTNSVTDEDVIKKLVEASCAGVECTLLVRGICCLVPGIKGYTENICVVSIVGRLLEHSRIYCFGAIEDNVKIYLSSADLMTRNLDKRVEIAWPIEDSKLKDEIVAYIGVCMSDSIKLRGLQSDGKYTPLGYFSKKDEAGLDSQQFLIDDAQKSNSTPAKMMQDAQNVLSANTTIGNPRDMHTSSVAEENDNKEPKTPKADNKSAKTIVQSKKEIESVAKKIKEDILKKHKIDDVLQEKKQSRKKAAKNSESAKTWIADSDELEKLSKKKKKKKTKSEPKDLKPAPENNEYHPVSKTSADTKQKAKNKNQFNKAVATEKIDMPEENAKKRGKKHGDDSFESIESFLNLFPDDNSFKMPSKKKGKWRN